MILRVGLTGGIASGKSTVMRTLGGLGCMVVDADAVVRSLYRPGEEGYNAIVTRYGRQILDASGEIDRARLSEIAFASPEAAQELNALIHPLVIAREEKMIAEEEERFPDRDRIVVVEATLLLESGGRKRYPRVVVVDVDPEVQVVRAVARGMSEKEARRRMARQISDES